MNAPTIRPFRNEDITAIADIYGKHVETGGGTYELQPPGEAEMAIRFEKLVAGGYPILVAEEAGGPGDSLVGYAYAGPYHTRPGWRFVIEDSVYVRAGRTGSGIGNALMDALIGACEADGRWRQLVAVIGDCSVNAGSVALHRRHGFREAGILKDSGWKFGRWMDTAYMQRPLGEGGTAAPAPGT